MSIADLQSVLLLLIVCVWNDSVLCFNVNAHLRSIALHP